MLGIFFILLNLKKRFILKIPLDQSGRLVYKFTHDYRKGRQNDCTYQTEHSDFRWR